MRTTIRAVSIALSLVAAVGAAAYSQGTARIAVVNTQTLMQFAPGTAKAESVYTHDLSARKQQLQLKQDSLQKMYDAYEKKLPTYKDSAKAADEKKITEFRTDYDALTLKNQQTDQQEEAALMAPIQEVVKKVLNDFRTDNGYAVIMDLAAGGIVAYDKNLDITDQIVDKLKTLALTGARLGGPGTPPVAVPAAKGGAAGVVHCPGPPACMK